MTRTVRLRQSLRTGQDGNVLVELAIILPVMVMLLIGMLDVGLVLNEYLRLCDSARSAAETATIRMYTANTSAMQMAGYYDANLNGYNITMTTYCICGPGSAQFSCGSGSMNYRYCNSYGLPNPYIKITASASLPLIFNLRGLPASITVQSIAVARIAWVGSGT